MPVIKGDPPFHGRCDEIKKGVIQFSDSLTLGTKNQIMPPSVDCNLPLCTAGVAELHGSAASKVVSLKPVWFLGCSWNFNLSATERCKYNYIKCSCVYNFTVKPN